MNMYESGKVTSKGQVTIPVEVRKQLGIATGDKIIVIIQNGEAKLEVRKQKKLTDLVGILKTGQEHDLQEARKSAIDWVGNSYKKGE
ncbi:AbrB/MazE/SpoVT family DNA-binding domain-containing protein [Paenibacillus xylanexedens]|uniref:AbrB/MazE/SpoVT family DNA-binding domain-containing protein n=1 Tax=Paenibacillus xylanexedens TaxID=528191 RepID=UPI003B028C69